MTDYDRIRNTCLVKNQLWEDPDFPAVQSSTFYHQTPPFNFQWLRAKEIYPNPKFIIDNQEAFDVDPGKLGDSWLVSCLAMLYLHKGLLYRVVPANQKIDSGYCGMFRFRLWWCGQWVEVLIDDRLPTVFGNLAFVHSVSSQQLWPALLEKAYAKLHGSYEALKYGSFLDGMTAMTGGVAELVSMTDITPAHLRASLANTSIVTAYLKDNQQDTIPLPTDRNYKITSVEEVETYYSGPISVVHLRRPLAAGQSEVPFVLLKGSQLRYIPVSEQERMNSGKGFWMPFADFMKVFGKLEVVHLDADTSLAENSFDNKHKWKMQIHQGAWKRGVTAGGCRNYVLYFHINPQIQIQLPEPDSVVVSLSQHIVMEPKVIGFSLYKIPMPLTEIAPSTLFRSHKSSITSQYTNSRQVTQRWQLDSGTYLIIPTTFDPREEAKFSLRIFTPKRLKMNVLDMQARVKKSAIYHAPVNVEGDTVSQYEAMFMQLADEHKTIDTFVLQELLEACLPNDYIKSCASIDTCRQIVLSLDKTGSGRISLTDFKDLMCSLKEWQLVFKNHAREKMGVLRAEELRESLVDIGFSLPEKALILMITRYMRKDGMLRFGDFVSVVMHLHRVFGIFHLHEDSILRTMVMPLSEWMINALMC